jgi:hypothetical protein
VFEEENLCGAIQLGIVRVASHVSTQIAKTNPLEFTNVKIIDMVTHNKLQPIIYIENTMEPPCYYMEVYQIP